MIIDYCTDVTTTTTAQSGRITEWPKYRVYGAQSGRITEWPKYRVYGA